MLPEMSRNLPENSIIYPLLSAHINLGMNTLASCTRAFIFRTKLQLILRGRQIHWKKKKTVGTIQKKNYPFEQVLYKGN